MLGNGVLSAKKWSQATVLFCHSTQSNRIHNHVRGTGHAVLLTLIRSHGVKSYIHLYYLERNWNYRIGTTGSSSQLQVTTWVD
jgi:hypothetical protein